MRLIILSLILFLGFNYAMSNETTLKLVIYGLDGTIQEFYLEENPKLMFEGENLIIKFKGTDVKFPFENLQKYTIDDENIYAAIDNVPKESEVIDFEKENIIFKNIKKDSLLEIYSPDGMLISKEIIRPCTHYAYPISDLPGGLYIFTINGNAYKILIK